MNEENNEISMLTDFSDFNFISGGKHTPLTLQIYRKLLSIVFFKKFHLNHMNVLPYIEKIMTMDSNVFSSFTILSLSHSYLDSTCNIIQEMGRLL